MLPDSSRVTLRRKALASPLSPGSYIDLVALRKAARSSSSAAAYTREQSHHLGVRQDDTKSCPIIELLLTPRLLCPPCVFTCRNPKGHKASALHPRALPHRLSHQATAAPLPLGCRPWTGEGVQQEVFRDILTSIAENGKAKLHEL